MLPCLIQSEFCVGLCSSQDALTRVTHSLQMRIPFTIMDHVPRVDYTARFMTHEGALASAVIAVAVWCLIAYILFLNKFFVSL